MRLSTASILAVLPPSLAIFSVGALSSNPNGCQTAYGLTPVSNVPTNTIVVSTTDSVLLSEVFATPSTVYLNSTVGGRYTGYRDGTDTFASGKERFRGRVVET